VIDAYWLEQREADVPREDDWLSPGEKACLLSLRIPKRRADWRLGRWTAKRALSLLLDPRAEPAALSNVEIRAATSGAPEVFIAGEPAPWTISISHCNGHALCAIARLDSALGCDLECVEPRSEVFLADYFTEPEQALVKQAPLASRPCLVTLLWSAKESALKALHQGLRLDTRSVVVCLPGSFEPAAHQAKAFEASADGSLLQEVSTWRPARVQYRGGEVLHGWWSQSGELIRTLVTAPAPNPPVNLK
jgi:4'-phosphopantetheinyl transferase